MFWHIITGLLMERAVTYSDHSTTVTMRYFTKATHKSYGPLTQLLPGPQCPNVTHVPTVLLQASSPRLPFFPSPHPPLSFHAQPFSPFSTCPPPILRFYFPRTCVFCRRLSVRLSAWSPFCLFVSLIINPFASRCPSQASPCLPLVLCPSVTYAPDRHPIAGTPRVLSTSCCVRMDVWRVLQASFIVTSA